MLEEHSDDGPEHAEVVESSRISGGVIRKKKPEEDEDEVLKTEGDPIYNAP